MDGAPPTDGRPPLGLTREALGYLVVSAGVTTAVLVLLMFPDGVPYRRIMRLVAALLVAAATASLNRYLTGEWYDRFTRGPDQEMRE